MKAIKIWAAAAALLVCAPAFAGLMTQSKDSDGDSDKRHGTWKSDADDSAGGVIHGLLSGSKRDRDSDSPRNPGASDHDDHGHPDAPRSGHDKDPGKPGLGFQPGHAHFVPPFAVPTGAEPSDDDDGQPILPLAPTGELEQEVVAQVDEPATLGLLGLAGLAALATRRRAVIAQRA